jgi:hypothetical protein
MLPATRARDPRAVTRIGAYVTDGDVLLQIIEVDYSGAVGGDVCSDELISIEPLDLQQRWRNVNPAKDVVTLDQLTKERTP